MPYYVFGKLPEEREQMLQSIDRIVAQADEERLVMFRKYEVAEV